MPDQDSRPGQVIGLAPASGDGPQVLVPGAAADQRPGPGLNAPDHADQEADHADHTDQIPGYSLTASTSSGDSGINAAAAAAYRASVQVGQPISERKLAEMFGRTSRRWARNRMAEARKNPVPA